MKLVLSYEQCCQGLNDLDLLISESVDVLDGGAVADHMGKLKAIQGYSARLMASCEYHKYLNPKDAECKLMYTLSERLNNAIGKSLSAFQSILGKLREERSMTPYGS